MICCIGSIIEVVSLCNRHSFIEEYMGQKLFFEVYIGLTALNISPLKNLYWYTILTSKSKSSDDFLISIIFEKMIPYVQCYES